MSFGSALRCWGLNGRTESGSRTTYRCPQNQIPQSLLVSNASREGHNPHVRMCDVPRNMLFDSKKKRTRTQTRGYWPAVDLPPVYIAPTTSKVLAPRKRTKTPHTPRDIPLEPADPTLYLLPFALQCRSISSLRASLTSASRFSLVLKPHL